MTLQIADRIKETSTTTGTGTVTLAGAQTGYRTFTSSITTGNTTYYCIQNQAVPSEWEVGIGTLATSSTLARTTILSSSTGSAVSFSAGTKDVFVTFPAVAVALPPLTGLNLSYLSTTSINVSSGSCTDSTGSFGLSLTSANVSTSSTGSGGIDTKSLTGTAATLSPGAGVTGTSTLWYTEFGTRALTGTISSTGTAITGTGTKFLSQTAVNDLIGNSTKGYVRIQSIASDTSITATSGVPINGGGAGYSSEAANCIEQPTMKFGTQAVGRIDGIQSNTLLYPVGSPWTSASGLSCTAGNLFPGDGSTNYFLHCFLVSPSGVILSTQRTTPLASYSAFKRLGAVPFDTSGAIISFTQSGGNRREFHFANNFSANLKTILSSGAATTYTKIQGRNVIPPTSTTPYIYWLISSGAGQTYLRPSNMPTPVPTMGSFALDANGSYNGLYAYVDSDGAGQMDYNCTTTGFAVFITVLGYVENLP